MRRTGNEVLAFHVPARAAARRLCGGVEHLREAGDGSSPTTHYSGRWSRAVAGPFPWHRRPISRAWRGDVARILDQLYAGAVASRR